MKIISRSQQNFGWVLWLRFHLDQYLEDTRSRFFRSVRNQLQVSYRIRKQFHTSRFSSNSLKFSMTFSTRVSHNYKMRVHSNGRLCCANLTHFNLLRAMNAEFHTCLIAGEPISAAGLNCCLHRHQSS